MNSKGEIIEATYNAEECLIGAILIESTDGTRNAINQIATILAPEEFYSDQHSLIYTAMLRCPLPPHQINTARQMLADKTLEDGVCSLLCQCVSVTPSSLDYFDYAMAVKRYSEHRSGIKHTPVKGAI